MLNDEGVFYIAPTTILPISPLTGPDFSTPMNTVLITATEFDEELAQQIRQEYRQRVENRLPSWLHDGTLNGTPLKIVRMVYDRDKKFMLFTCVA